MFIELTEKKQIKVKKLSEIYFSREDSCNEINEEKIIDILKENKWHMTNATQALFDYHYGIIAEKNRIENLPNNVVRPSDSVGHEEIWCEFYKCPNCHCVTLTGGENYCSDCGIKVYWSEFK